MLLHSTTCQQPWRTSTILCHQRHRQGSEILESKTGPQTRTASGTMALGYELDTQPSTTSHHPRPHDQAVQYYTPDSFCWHCIYQISFGYGQPLAITKRQPIGGPKARPQFVRAQLSDNIHFHLTKPINTSLSMEMHYDSPMHHSHLLPPAHFKTRSSHHPRRSTTPFVPL